MRVALAHAARDGRGVAVILADVDAMKDINDSFGHAVGDDVLRRLARTLSRGVRSGDTVARVGGDEFVVLARRARGDRYRLGGHRTSARRGVPCAGRTGRGRVRRHGQLRSRGRHGWRCAGGVVASAPTPRCTAPRRWAAPRSTVFEGGADDEHHDARGRARGRGQPWPDPAACAVGRRPSNRACSLDTKGSRVGIIPGAGSSTRNNSSTSWRARRSCRSSTSPCSDGLPRRWPARARSGLRMHAYGHLSRRLLGDVDRRALPHRDHRRLGDRPLGSLRRDRAGARREAVAHGAEHTFVTLREIGVRIVLSGARWRVRGQRDRRVRIRRAPARAAPRPRRRPRPDTPARRARHHRARPRTRSHRDRGRDRERRRPGSTCATPDVTTAREPTSDPSNPPERSTERSHSTEHRSSRSSSSSTATSAWPRVRSEPIGTEDQPE